MRSLDAATCDRPCVRRKIEVQLKRRTDICNDSWSVVLSLPAALLLLDIHSATMYKEA